jgi:hypothetical protein
VLLGPTANAYLLAILLIDFQLVRIKLMCKIIPKVFLAVVFLAGGLALAGELNDWLLVPGKRAGPITKSSSKADLEKIFGSKNVRADFVGPEATEPGLIINEGPKGKRDEKTIVVYLDSEGKPMWAEVSGLKSKWHLENGIQLGTTLDALKKMNGEKVTYAGSETCAGGRYDFHNGKLEKMKAELDGGVSDNIGLIRINLKE